MEQQMYGGVFYLDTFQEEQIRRELEETMVSFSVVLTTLDEEHGQR